MKWRLTGASLTSPADALDLALHQPSPDRRTHSSFSFLPPRLFTSSEGQNVVVFDHHRYPGFDVQMELLIGKSAGVGQLGRLAVNSLRNCPAASDKTRGVFISALPSTK